VSAPANAPTAGEEALWDLAALAEARGLADWMFEQFRPYVADRAIEVGAGIGTFSERLLAAGVESLLLVEPEPVCFEALVERFGADARVRLTSETLPDAPSLVEQPERFGHIVCQNVLEHVAADGDAVAVMAACLRSGGVLSVLVPAHPRLFGSLDRAYGHERRYTRERLRALVEAAGLEVVELYSFNLLGVAGWVAQSLRGSTRIGTTSLAAYERLLRIWRPIERRVRPPVGLSLVVHARRPQGSGAGT